MDLSDAQIRWLTTHIESIDYRTTSDFITTVGKMCNIEFKFVKRVIVKRMLAYGYRTEPGFFETFANMVVGIEKSDHSNALTQLVRSSHMDTVETFAKLLDVLLSAGVNINAGFTNNIIITILDHMSENRGMVWYKLLEVVLERGADPQLFPDSIFRRLRLIYPGVDRFVMLLQKHGLNPDLSRGGRELQETIEMLCDRMPLEQGQWFLELLIDWGLEPRCHCGLLRLAIKDRPVKISHEFLQHLLDIGVPPFNTDGLFRISGQITPEVIAAMELILDAAKCIVSRSLQQ